MIPLVAYRREFDILADVIRATAKAVETETGAKLHFEIGTMIELPRAALKADELAAGDDGAAFFSFGTNDLTQTALGLSRDDAAPILSNYAGRGIFEMDPFVSIDKAGVGELVRIGVEKGRAVNPKLKIGICGEHGGDAASVAFFDAAGLDYVSCSPFRLPIARLAAAQAAIRSVEHQSRPRRNHPPRKKTLEHFLVQLVELWLARLGAGVLAREQNSDHQRRQQEAPRGPGRGIAVLRAGQDETQDSGDDGRDTPTDDPGHRSPLRRIEAQT